MKNELRTFLTILLLIIGSLQFVACTREAQKTTSSVTVHFPSSTLSKVTSAETSKKVTSEKPNFDYTLVPANYSQIDCLLVFAGGPEDFMRVNYCEKSADKSQNFKFGVFVGAVSKEQSVTFEVPSGSSRYIRLYGMKKPTSSSLCPAIAASSDDNLLSGFSTPYFLGESKPTEMLPGATISVEIPVVAAIDSSAYFDDCKGPSFGSGTGTGGGSTDSSKPYLRIEGLHNFNKIENPSFARPMARGACYPFTFKTFKPCNGGQCEAYTLQNALTINTGSNFKFFNLETDCQNDTNPVSNFTMSAGQNQIPASGTFYMRAPLGQIGLVNTDLSNEISISTTTEVNFNQSSFTNIDISKPKIVFSNLPGSLTYGSCASGTNSIISVFEDSAATIPMNSHEVLPFDSIFLMAKTVGCGTQILGIQSNLSVLTVNLAKPSDASSGITGSSVYAIIFDPISSKYYVAGLFTAYGGKNVGNIIRLNTDGSYDPSFDSGVGFDGGIFSLVSDGTGGVFVGGSFLNYKGISVKKLARLDQNGKLDLNFGFDFNGDIYKLKLSGAILYVGGIFNQINGQSRAYIGSIDVASRTLTNWNPSASNLVKALEVDGSNVFVGGNFTTIGGQSRNRIAAIDATSGLATSWNPNSNANVTELAVNGSILYVGGAFSTIGGQTRNRVAGLDTSTGLATSWNPNANGNINAIDVSATTVYMGGAFTTIGGQARNSVAALDIATGLATSWNPNISGSSVSSIKINGSNVIFGGVFTQAGGLTANKLAAVDSTSAALSNSELNPYWGTLIFNSLFYDYTPFSISP